MPDSRSANETNIDMKSIEISLDRSSAEEQDLEYRTPPWDSLRVVIPFPGRLVGRNSFRTQAIGAPYGWKAPVVVAVNGLRFAAHPLSFPDLARSDFIGLIRHAGL
jgi:hypothetical protein